MSSPGRLDILGDVLDAIDAIYKEQAKMWQDTAALRDELHESNVMTSESIGALSHRIESLTRWHQNLRDQYDHDERVRRGA